MQFPVLLDRSSTSTLTNQLFEQMRDAIRQGRLGPGIKLPSTRVLAAQLDIGRNTAVRAYDLLAMEGFIEARPASGVFVRQRPVASLRKPIEPSAADRKMAVAMPVPRDGGGSSPTVPHARGKLSFDFAPGRPNSDLFPMKTWRRLLQSALTQGGAGALTHYGDVAGLVALRSSIAEFLLITRGIVADPGRVLIVSGVQEGLTIIARLLARRGARIAMETPGYRGAVRVLEAEGAEIVGVPLDEDGLQPDGLPSDASMLFVTPAHQYPTGAVLSPERRGDIVRWARKIGCYIVEDDYDGDIRFEGGPVEAIAAIAPDCTIHLGSFSKSLGAGLRLGYMVLPSALVEPAIAIKSLLNQGSSYLEQAALSEFIISGGYSAHLARIRVDYRAARDRLLAALNRSFGEVAISGASGGLHLFWQLPPGIPDAMTLEGLARRTRIGIYSLGAANVWEALPSPLARRGIVLGFASLSLRQIDQGISRLSDMVDDTLDLQHGLVHELLLDRPSGRAQIPTVRRPRRPGLVPRGPHEPALSVPTLLRAQSSPASAHGSDHRMPVLTGLYHYPVKGLSPQPLERVNIAPGQPFPFDRVFALARPGATIDAANPGWAKKGLFIMLMLEEQLAEVQSHLDIETLRITLYRNGEQLLSADLGTPAGCAALETFVQELVPTLNSTPRLVRSRDRHFMDKPDNVISLINLATIRSLEKQWGIDIDPLRFRANIYIDDAAPWAEFDWIGHELRVGDGIFTVDRRNGRCGATNVNPANGRRDLDIPGSLRSAFGHKDLGVYLVAKTDVSLAVGSELVVPYVKPIRIAPTGLRNAVPTSFMCRGCYFVYDEKLGYEKDGIAPRTSFATIPADWRCPDCGTDKSKFRVYAP